MSLLAVVRHGQASFLSDNYDRLSSTGEEQSRHLARYWLERGIRFDRVYHGPAERQIRTGAIVGDAFRQSGAPWPEPVAVPELDEFPAEDVVRTFVPRLLAAHPQIREWVSQLRGDGDRRTKQRAFDSMLRDVSQRWLRGEVHAPEIPTWQDFCHRIETAIRRIAEETPRSASVAVFTSSGPMAATARVALGLSYEATLELTWSPRNSAVSEFLFTPGRFSLSTFNATPHLEDPALITYR